MARTETYTISNADYYAILSISSNASPSEVKAAYHRALLVYHPDKQTPDEITVPIDMDLLKQAFTTLYDPELKANYDAARTARMTQLGPRPAQVISLDDFTQQGDADERWTYPCRCGGDYVVTGETLDREEHLVGCTSCSEVVWAGYEAIEDAECDRQ